MSTQDEDRDDDALDEANKGAEAGEGKVPAIADEPGGEEIVLVEGDDERLSADQRDDRANETPDEKLERRRRERRERKENRKAGREQDSLLINGLANELAQVKAQLTQIGGKQQQQDLGQVEHAAKEWNTYAERQRQIRADAVERGDKKAFADADREYEKAVYNARYYAGVIDTAKRAAPQAQSQQQGGQDEAQRTIQNNASIFMRKHSWYDPNGSDERSQIVQRLDAEVMRDGFNPSTARYWQELEKRVADELDDEDEPPRSRRREADPPRSNGRGAPPVGGRSDAPRRADNPNTIYVPPALKSAMQEAGQWDDPKVRNRVLRDYQANLKRGTADRR